MQIRPRHMLVGGIVAAVLHLGVGLLLALPPAALNSGAESAGIRGIEIALGPAGGAPGEAQPVAEETETVEAIEPVEVATEWAERIEAAVATPTVEPKPEPVTATEPLPTPVAAPVVAETPLASETAEAAPPVRTARIPAGSQGESGTREQPTAGSQSAVQAGGSPAARADYISVLRAWLEQHKQYPRRARMRRQQGTAVLRFTMNRAGQVLAYQLEESSGYTLLDEEVEAMIERAQPLPVMPNEMQQAQLELVVPVQFFLR